MTHRARVALGMLLALLLVATAAVSFVSYRAGQSLLHPARAAVVSAPAEAWEGVQLRAMDGVALEAWWMPADATPEDDLTVIFLHGYGETRQQALHVEPFLRDAGHNVLALDFRGHGESGGEYTTVGVLEQRDVRAAVDWLAGRPGFGEDPRVALLGWSMGGAIAILYAAGDPRIDAVIADSAFTRVAAVAGAGVERYTGLPPWPFGPLAVQFAAWSVGVRVSDAAPVERVAEVEAPILLIHGTDDSFIPVEHVDAIARAADPAPRVLRFEGAEHVGAHGLDRPRYEREVLAFLARAVATRGDARGPVERSCDSFPECSMEPSTAS